MITAEIRELQTKVPPGYAIVPLVATPFMLASTLPDASEPTIDEKRLGAEAFTLTSPTSDYRIADGVLAGSELARDWRNMVVAALADPALK